MLKVVGSRYFASGLDIGDKYTHPGMSTVLIRIPTLDKHRFNAQGAISCRYAGSNGILWTRPDATVIYLGREEHPNSNV